MGETWGCACLSEDITLAKQAEDIHVSACVVYDANGLPEYAIAMLQDTSNGKQAQVNLQQAHDQLEKRVIERTAELTEVNTRLRQEIAERQQAQEALYESEQRYRLLIERMNEGVTIVDEQGWLLYINEKYGEMLGYTPAEMVGHHTSEFLDEANMRIVRAQIAKRKTGEGGSYELELRRKDGQRLLVIVSASAILDREGNFEASFVVATNITALKAVESELQQAKEQLRAVLDAVPGFVSWINPEGRYLGVNQQLANAFNLSPDAFIGKELGFLQTSPEFAQFIEHFLVIPAQKNQQIVEVQVNGSTRNYLIAAQKYNQNTATVAVGIDITEHKQAEVALKKNHEFLQTVLDTNPSSIFVKDRAGKYVLANRACADFHGTTVADLVGKTDAESNLNPANVELFTAIDQIVFTTLEQQLLPENAIYTPTGELRWVQTIKKPIFASDGQVHHIFGVCIDITKRKQAEEQLHQSEGQLRLALEAAQMGFWDWDIQTGQITWSRHLERLYGVAPNTYDGTYDAFIACVHPKDRDRLQQAAQASITRGENYDIEFRIIWPDGSIRWIGSKGQVFLNETGKIVRMAGINLDITKRKQAEIQVKESLREKEVLLQEIHHRVKNNLQVISSLLDLQSHHIQEPAAHSMFQESQNRVKSMALVHEKLYQSKNFARINAAEYIENLTSDLFQAYGVNADKITLELDIDDITLNIDTTIPCGLIISELVSNALKYAFPNQANGIIKVSLQAELNKTLTLIVKDNGVGLPEDWDFNSIKSLGLQLVNVLTGQLEGTLDLDHSMGTEFRISFSELSP